MKRNSFVDLVIGGPDMSGTSTQVEDIIEYFSGRKFVVRDIRGTEIDALFHASSFNNINRQYKSLKEFCNDLLIPSSLKNNFFIDATQFLIKGGTNLDLRIASMVENDISTYIDPNSADVWVMEEPTKRGAGQVNRVVEQNRSKFGGQINPIAAAETHSVYRTDEFLRFRKILREKGKIILRSRSEESACYQIFDFQNLPNGASKDYYLNLSGHNIAFGNPPTHIFVVCGPESWTEKDYLKLKKERSGKDRIEDDHERSASYQILVNGRYATDWLENLYKEGCGRFGGIPPKIVRFNIYDSKFLIKEKMISELEKILH